MPRSADAHACPGSQHDNWTTALQKLRARRPLENGRHMCAADVFCVRDRSERMHPVSQPTLPVRILQIHEASKEWFAMLAGAQLDLFTPLDNGPMQADELALARNVDAGKLSLLL